jgi:uncharacterized membrane protein HdeD (DUF308 family)
MSDPAAATAHPPHFAAVRAMATAWWVFALRGLAAILFGVLAFLAPGAGLAVILAFLAAWMVVDGVATLYQAVKGPPERHGVWFWVDGIASLIAAAALLLWPAASALVLVLIAGVWSIAVGVFRLVLAFRLKSVLLGLLGAVTVLVGAWLVAYPGPGLLALIWLVGIEAVVIGVLQLGVAWRLRRIHHDPHAPATGL